MQTNPQPIPPQAGGLRPVAKPLMVELSSPFMKACSGLNLVKLINLVKHIFLRLGFDGYKGENSEDGFRIRICGHNLNTGRHCDSHSVKIGNLELSDNFTARIDDRGGFYVLSLNLARESSGQEDT